MSPPNLKLHTLCKNFLKKKHIQSLASKNEREKQFTIIQSGVVFGKEIATLLNYMGIKEHKFAYLEQTYYQSMYLHKRISTFHAIQI